MDKQKQKKHFSGVVECGHCHNKAPMEIVHIQSETRESSDSNDPFLYNAGDVYELLKCPACEGISLRKYYWNDAIMDGSDVQFELLYPLGEKSPRGLPDKIARAYEAAQKVRNIDANAYGVLLGRVLDFICEDRQASGKTLDEKLQNLAQRGEIPDKLVSVATGIRRLRNVGAHADLGELTSAELPVLDDLTLAILEYVYYAPLLATEAQERLAKLKHKSKASIRKK
jgi:hypothetical protein